MKSKAVSKTGSISFSGERIEYSMRYSKRKTLAITVRPDLSIVVTAPRGANPVAVRAKVAKRALWIRKQRRFFERFLPSVPPRRYVSGETHRYRGRQYRLKVVASFVESVKLKGQFIRVETTHKPDPNHVRRLLDAWYLAHAKIVFARSLAACVPKLHGRIGKTPLLYLRHMPKRWGSWTKRGAIYLNPELVRAPSSCIDYVVMHELCHLLHENHGRAFLSLLRRLMPDWEIRKARLEIAMSS